MEETNPPAKLFLCAVCKNSVRPKALLIVRFYHVSDFLPINAALCSQLAMH